MNAVLQIGNEALTPEEVMPLLAKYQVWPHLLQGIVIDQAIASINCTLSEKENAVQSFYQQSHLESEGDRQVWLQQQGMTSEQLESWVAQKIRLEKFKQIVWAAEIEAYFEQRKPQLDHVVYSLIRVNNEALAQDIYNRLKNNPDAFSNLAQYYPEAQGIYTTGLTGPVELGQVYPEIARIFSDSVVGQFFPVTPLGEWFVIVRLEDVLPAELTDQMRRRLLNELFEKWVKDRVQNILSHSKPDGEKTIIS